MAPTETGFKSEPVDSSESSQDHARFIPGTVLGERYRVVSLLGRGGMGEVYRADDLKLGQPVALKFLPVAAEHDRARLGRLLNEVKTALKVTHPNVCRVYDIGEATGQHYLSMEYVDGEDLASLLRRIERPPQNKAVRIARQLCAGLAAAHDQGILHRDLKPANVMIDDQGRAKIADFGLASLAQVTGAADIRAGTPAYMAPEQLAGKEVTFRSDVYSLGLVLYELFTGKRALEARTAGELLLLREPPTVTPPSSHVPDLDPAVEQVILRCLEKEPSKRYQGAAGILEDIEQLTQAGESGSQPRYPSRPATTRRRRRLAWAAVVIAAVGTIVAAVWLSRLSRFPPLDQSRVLVLPIEIRAEKPGKHFVAQALAESIAINLALAADLSILPVPEAAEVVELESSERLRYAIELGAGRVLSASLVDEEDESYLTLSLIDTIHNRIVWGKQEDASDGDLSKLASNVGTELVAVLGGTIPELYGYPLYAKGGPDMATSPELLAVVTLFASDAPPEELIAAADDLVAAFPDELDAHALRLMMLYDRRYLSRLDRACEALDRVDPNNPYSLMIRSTELTLHRGDPASAMEGYDAILERRDLTPAARAWVLRTRSRAQRLLGDLRGAVDGLQEAALLEPANPWTLFHLAVSRYEIGDYAQSQILARNVLALEPDFTTSYFLVGATLAGTKDWDDAVPFFAKACERSRSVRHCAIHALSLAKAGRFGESKEAAARVAQLGDDMRVAYYLSWLVILAGDGSSALKLLDHAARLGLRELPVVSSPDCSTSRSYCIYGFVEATTVTNPDFESLFDSPDFKRIASQIREQTPRLKGEE